jgi:murein DD-endopeptidase MepM/ murein hydrolase activator NlpD
MRIRGLLLTTLLLLSVAAFNGPALGISIAAGPIVYTVQPGDTLVAIALRYGTTVEAIALANDLANPNLIIPGQRLIIPPGNQGLPGSQLQTAPTTIVYAEPGEPRMHTIQPGETLSLIAFGYGVTIDDLVAVNNLTDPSLIQASQRLIIPAPALTNPLPTPFAAVKLTPLPIVRGETLVIYIRLQNEDEPAGAFDGRPLLFAHRKDESGATVSWALAGISAVSEVGSYPLSLTAHDTTGQTVTATLMIPVAAGFYRRENISLSADTLKLLAPQIIETEMEKLSRVLGITTPYPLWQGLFRLPVQDFEITSFFGTRRSYDEGQVSGYHEGIDVRGKVGTPVYAPAAGRVVLAEPLNVRGKAVVLDHGLGVHSGYWHLSEIDVRVGQDIAQGDLLGKVGDTGLANGPHLHWELRVGGIPVNPLQWTEQAIP